MPILPRSEKTPLGIYIHIPFCRSKCQYCDFYSLADTDRKLMDRYLKALCTHIKETGALAPGYRVDTVYFGGGTPSFFGADALGAVLTAVRQNFDVSPRAEITFEANPDSVTPRLLHKLKSEGFNRVSLGIQTDDNALLQQLGRPHTFEDAEQAVKRIRRAGFRNLSVDLMYGLPGQTVESFKETLRAVIDLSPEHISVYGLILEEGTPLYEKQSTLSFPSEDSEYEMYLLADRHLSRAGYSHYEISNYSRAGKESRHNLKYWRCEEYIGVGVSAHSYLDGYRFGRTQSLTEYLRGNREYLNKEYIDRDGEALEKIMLGLRLREGISLKEYEDLFGFDLTEKYREKLITFEKMGYARILSGRLSLTAEGFYVSNYIINELTEST